MMRNLYLYIYITVLSLFLISLTTELRAKDKSLGLRTVVIDAGHGGKDPGCVSKDRKTYEKNVVLDISKRFGQKIKEKYPDVKVVYTRSTDVYVTLNDRAAIANKNNADLFISIHINANDSPSIHGASVHILGQSRDPKRDLYAGKMDVSRRENSVILLEDDYSTDYQGFDPDSPESFIFFNLMQNAYYEQSVLFASKVDEHLRKTDFAVSKYTGIHQDPFWLLWKTAMPAVLIELGFISNLNDLKILTSADGRNDIANKLLDAFSSFKKSYDASLDARNEPVAGAPSTKPETLESEPAKPAPVKQAPVKQESVKQESVKTESVTAQGSAQSYYGIQIMGLGRLLKNGDPALKGLEIQAVKAPESNIYKYITGVYPDRDTAASKLAEVRKKFPEAFLVKVERTTVVRLR